MEESLGRLRARASALSEAADDARRELSRFQESLQNRVLKDLRVVLGEDDPALTGIEAAAHRLRSVPEAHCDARSVVEMAKRQAEGHVRLQELLAEVKRELDEAGPAGRGGAG